MKLQFAKCYYNRERKKNGPERKCRERERERESGYNLKGQMNCIPVLDLMMLQILTMTGTSTHQVTLDKGEGQVVATGKI